MRGVRNGRYVTRPWVSGFFVLAATVAGASQPSSDLLWYRNGQPTVQAQSLVQQLDSAEQYGLRASAYAVGPLDGSLQSDRALSAAALRLATDLHFGRIDPQAAGFHLARARQPLEGRAIATRLASSPDIAADLRALEPPFGHYQLLKQALARYRSLAEVPSLTQLPALPKRSLTTGDSYPGAPALRRLLHALGDLPEDAAPESGEVVIDVALSGALLRYQQRHGLMGDGQLGRKTYQSLTTPLSTRVRQIELTLERWRWLPELPSPPIIVNIPQFRLFAFRTTEDRAADILQIPVIVGQTYPHTRTPIFISEMKYVVFRPYWDVPRSIVRNELLAPIRASPGYLARNRFELVRGEGDDGRVVEPSAENIQALASGKLRLRQRPGDDNALGLIKFVMPNNFNVYLHDTPAQRLFSEPQRAFSHGCIRVADPVALAVHVLRANEGDWSSAAVKDAMQGADARRVVLQEPVTVMVLYGTALATEDGRVLFFDDIYGHDRRLDRLLRAAASS
jgi:murein L,D-transpeptidase YcbB/YkuD